jgi:hypothetical protein
MEFPAISLSTKASFHTLIIVLHMEVSSSRKTFTPSHAHNGPYGKERILKVNAAPAAMMHRDALDVNTPKKIAEEIEQIIPSDVNTIFEIGSGRRLEYVTCHLKKNIIQVDTFLDLEQIHGKGRAVYFIYDRDMLNA